MSIIDLVPLLAQATDAAGGEAAPANGLLSILLMFAPFLLLMWFFVIRPQQSERKRHDRMIDALKVNDKIVTIGGLCGSITNINKEKNTCQIRVDDKNNVKITLLLTGIAYAVEEPADNAAAKSDAASKSDADAKSGAKEE